MDVSCNNLHYVAEHVRAGRTLAIAALFIECSIGQNIVYLSVDLFFGWNVCAVRVKVEGGGSARSCCCHTSVQSSKLNFSKDQIIKPPPAPTHNLLFPSLSPPRIAIHFLAPVSSSLNNTYIKLLSTRTTNT